MAELKRNGDDKEAKKAVFEATANRINQEAEFYQATLRFQKQIEQLNDAEKKQKEELNALRAQELEQKQNLEQVNERLAEQQNIEIEQTPAVVQGKLNVNAAQDAVNKANALGAKTQKDSIAIDNVKRDSLNKLTQSLFMAGQFSKELAIAGVLASRFQSVSEIISNTGIANAKAVAASPLTAGMPWVAINTASAGFAIGATIANALSSIAGITKAAGGGNFLTKGPTLLMVGDNPGGVERVTVEPLSGKGKTTVGNGMIKMAGGGTLTTGLTGSETRLATAQAQMMTARVEKIMQPILVLQDFEAVQSSRDTTVNKATVLG